MFYMERLYFDWAATSLPDKEILEKTMEKALELYANPSSTHTEGKKARELLGWCRNTLAERLKARPEQIVFTSGGTESNNLIIFSLLNRKKAAGEILISGIEHAAVFEPASCLRELGWKMRALPPIKTETSFYNQLAESITPETEFVSVMTVNNETGLILPPAEVSKTIRSVEKKTGKSVFFHTDGVQALGKQPIDLESWDADAASFSGHKIGGPRGTGLLYLKKPVSMLNRGGGQEMGLRGGTENLPGIYGLTLAVEKRYGKLKEDLEKAVKIKEYLVNELSGRAGADIILGRETALSEKRSPWILMAAFPPIPGEVLARVLNDRGAAVSTGSACSSRQKKTFRVSDGLGISREKAFSAIRLSWGPETDIRECGRLVKIISDEVEILRKVTGKGKRKRR